MADDVRIVVSVNNATGPGFTAVNQSLNQLRRNAGQTGGTVGDLTGQMGDLAGAAGGAAGAVGSGSGGGGLKGALIGVGAAAGLSVLPAIGALVPMITGLGVAGAAAIPIFNGMKDSWEASAKKGKEFEKALKGMSGPQRAFTGALRDSRREFEGLGDEIRKATFDEFTNAIVHAQPVLKTFRGGVKDMSGVLGDLAEDAGRHLGSDGFQGILQKNMDMGLTFVDTLMRSFGSFGVSLLEFGAKSRETFDALNGGIGELLSQGLPGFFEGLSTGISGTAQYMDGLFEFVNRLLPAFGELTGAISDSLGPAFGELLSLAGKQATVAFGALTGAVRLFSPIFTDLGFAVKSVNQILEIVAPTVRGLASAITGALVPAGASVDKIRGPFQRLSEAIDENKMGIQEVSRIFADGILNMVIVAVENLPRVVGMFSSMAQMITEALYGILASAAEGFGWIPGVGDKLKKARDSFYKFSTTFISGLEAGRVKAEGFSAEVGPKLRQNKLLMNISNWESQIAEGKEKLKTVPKSKRADLLARIAQLKKNVDNAKGELRSIKDKSVNVNARTGGARAGIRGVGNALGSLRSRTVTVRYRRVFQTVGNAFGFAHGGVVSGGGGRGMAHGGVVGNRAAAGGPRGAMTLVGEQGPELVNLPFGSRVRTNGDSKRVMRGMAGGGGGQARGAGEDVVRSLVAGMAAQVGTLVAGTRRISDAVVTGVKEPLGIDSPSRVFAGIGENIAEGLVLGLLGSTSQVAAAAGKVAATATDSFKTKSKSGFDKALGELTALVGSGKWTKKGSMLFEDISFQGMSKNFGEHQMKIADGFWDAVAEIKKAVASGKRVFEDMTFKGMSANVDRYHGVIADVWRGNPWGSTFGDFGKQAAQGADLKRRATGGMGGGRTLLGERGPELVDLPTGSRVHPAGNSRRMTGAGASGGPIHIHLTLGGHDLGEVIIDPLRRSIQTRGGSVQAVLGQRGVA